MQNTSAWQAAHGCDDSVSITGRRSSITGLDMAQFSSIDRPWCRAAPRRSRADRRVARLIDVRPIPSSRKRQLRSIVRHSGNDGPARHATLWSFLKCHSFFPIRHLPAGRHDLQLCPNMPEIDALF